MTSARVVKPALFVACLLPLVYVGWKFATDRLGANPIRELEIETGLWTLRFLAVTLSITPVRKALGWNSLVKYRRMLGVFTFAYACVHLSMWVGVDWFFAWSDMWGEIVKHKYILIGMTTWLALLPLAITSTKGWVRRLGKRWTTLHRLVYVAGICAGIHFIGKVKVVIGDPVLYASILAVLLGFRVVWALRKRIAVRRGATAAA